MKKKIFIGVLLLVIFIPVYTLKLSQKINEQFIEAGFQPITYKQTKLTSGYTFDSKEKFVAEGEAYSVSFVVNKNGVFTPRNFNVSINFNNQKSNFNIFLFYKKNKLDTRAFDYQVGNTLSETCPVNLKPISYDKENKLYTSACSSESQQKLLKEKGNVITDAFGEAESKLNFLSK